MSQTATLNLFERNNAFYNSTGHWFVVDGNQLKAF